MASALSDQEHIMLSSKKNEELVKLISPKNTKVIVLASIMDSLAPYKLRSPSFQIISDFIEYRSALLSCVSSGYIVFIDIDNIRNKLMHYGLPTFFLPLGTSIYDSFESEFSRQLYFQSLHDKTSNQVSIFPYGSSTSRAMSSDTLRRLVRKCSENGLRAVIYLHKSELKRKNHSDLKFAMYATFTELFSCISQSVAVISVDSLHLHLAFFLRKKVFLLTDSHHIFIPTALFNSQSVFELNPSFEKINLIANTCKSIQHLSL